MKGVAALVLAPFAAVVMLRDENWEAAIIRFGENFGSITNWDTCKREREREGCIFVLFCLWNLAADWRVMIFYTTKQCGGDYTSLTNDYNCTTILLKNIKLEKSVTSHVQIFRWKNLVGKVDFININ